eukprot:TRINITY_DN10955_c0_g1_i3.p1 TRINITY_DN10955_c0_g1~~TRINITY_DN10955_c0_g1_i3.p1  ORF type:complete len:539 (-),score=124.86 TRINITY_DN10955_c0_g1_i3:137-1753(-)
MKTPTPPKSKALKEIALTTMRFMSLITCLYFFICSLSFLSDSFRLLGGKNLGALFKNSELLNNPVVGVMIGVLVTVLVQSSSTSTTIIVGLVAANVPVKTAIPMIMGSNIGTSVTNTIVSFTQMSDRNEFRRAFACATVHDMFNWLSVITLVTVEVCTGYLEKMTGAMVATLGDTKGSSKPPDFLKVLTKPFTKSIIQLNKKVLSGWARNDPKYENSTTVLKTGCGDDSTVCPFLFANLGPEGANIGDSGSGIILLTVALIMLCGCLICLVKLLNSILGERVKEIIKNGVNKDIPIKYLGWLTEYLVMIVGAFLTIIVQSSSVFTSTLTPLAGAGLVSLERAYPLTLGSNIGTTTTSLLAALASKGHEKEAIQIALVHLCFNITGILLFYPIPFMRWPVPLAQKLGDITSQYRWFSVAYLLLMFFIFPAIIFALSLAGPVAMYIILIPIAALVLVIIFINLLQKYKPSILPTILKDWDFLPEPLRSLDPIDRVIMATFSCFKICRSNNNSDADQNQNLEEMKKNKQFKLNKGFEKDVV